MSSSIPVIAILGGGFAGLKTVLLLERQLRADEAEVVLIDRSPYHALRPKLPQAVGGRIACSVHVPFQEIIAGKNIRFIQDGVTAVHPDELRIELEGGEAVRNGAKSGAESQASPDGSDTKAETELRADYLVVALGSESRAPGETFLPAWSFGQACGIRKRVEFLAQAAQAGEAAHTDIVVVGAGFVGVEIAAEIQHKLHRIGATAHGVRTVLIEQESRILPRLPARAAALTERRLQQLGVDICTSTKVEGAEQNKVLLADGRVVPAGLMLWAGGAHAAAPVSLSALADETGRAPLDERLRSTRQSRIYMAGDCGYVAKSETHSYEQSAHRAEAQASVVAANIVADLRGTGTVTYRPGPEKYLLGLGPGYGVLANKSSALLSGFIPSLMKEAVILKHLLQIGGPGLVRKTLHNVTGTALRAKYWDGEPLHEGNVCWVGEF